MNGREQKLLDLYHDRLSSIPSPGGNGCHPDLLGTANLGIMAEVPPEQVFEDICGAIPRGKRIVTHREIADAVNKAAEDHKVIVLPSGENYRRYSQTKPKPVVDDGPAALRKLIDQGKGVTEADIWEASPIPLGWPPEEDAIQVLTALYGNDDVIYIGESYADGVIGQNIRTCSEWIDHLSHEGKPAPHIIPNPLNGQPVEKKSGDGLTLRGDGNVCVFRFCMVEFDDMSREDQLSFWASINLPISALIDSGGKSIHGWLDVRKLADVPTSEAWDHHIRNRLYGQILEPMGVDSACKNPSRLSRFPGYFRTEKNNRQRLLYLSPTGRKVF
jgi:hypothetical protein